MYMYVCVCVCESCAYSYLRVTINCKRDTCAYYLCTAIYTYAHSMDTVISRVYSERREIRRYIMCHACIYERNVRFGKWVKRIARIRCTCRTHKNVPDVRFKTHLRYRDLRLHA